MIKRNRYDPGALTKAQIKKLISIIDNQRDSILIRLGLYSGCRVNELTTLNAQNVNYKAGTIRVWDQKKDTYYNRKKKKSFPALGRKYRTIYVPIDLLLEIQAYQGRLKNKKHGSVFGLNYRTYEKVLHKYTEIAFGARRSWHVLRHTYATQSLNSGRSIKYVARQMGDDEAVVARVYHQQSPEQIEKERAIDIYS